MKRILVANRGEIAVRVIRAAHDLGLEAVAVYSTADADALHVRMADEAVEIGPPPAARSYLEIAKIVDAARATAAEAVHPGYGFLSERADFARACEDAGLGFVGPRSEHIALMGDKARAREAARASGVPTLAGSEGAVDGVEGAISIASEIGYPIALKAAAGGGGHGHRDRSRRRAVADRRGGAATARAGRDRRSRLCARVADQRRGSKPRFSAIPGHSGGVIAAVRTVGPRRHLDRAGKHGAAVL